MILELSLSVYGPNQPKSLSGIETFRGAFPSACVFSVAGINLNPYQGLKLISASLKSMNDLPCRNQPKSLSGIETKRCWNIAAVKSGE